MKIDKRNKLLFVGILALLFASYYLAINKTILLGKQTLRLQTEVEQFNDIPKKLSLLNKKNVQYDSILGIMDMVDTSIQNNLLRTINQEAAKKNIKVMDFNQPHIYQSGENNFFTYRFNLNGTFTDILNVIHGLEQKGNFGEIVHVDFQKKKNYKTNKSSLSATVFLQQVK